MNQMRGLDVTFAVHPRPATHDSDDHADLVLAQTGLAPPVAKPDEPVAQKDTFIGDLIFLARFAFGRY